MIADEARPDGALQTGTEEVVNCAAVYPLEPNEQFVLTLQSYTVEAVKPLIATDVEEVAVAAFVHVPLDVNL